MTTRRASCEPSLSQSLADQVWFESTHTNSLQQRPAHVGSSTINGASANLINAVIGVGIITLPETLNQAGAYLGTLLIIVSVLLSWFTSWLLIATAKKAALGAEPVTSYGELCRRGIGEGGFYALTVMTFCMMFGCLMSYAIIFRIILEDCVSDCLGHSFQHGWALLLAAAVGVMLPLSLLKSMSSLARSSTISACSVLIILIIICLRAPIYHDAMKAMTRTKMTAIERNLDTERAIYLCEWKNQLKKPVDPFYEFKVTLSEREIQRLDHLWEELVNSEHCKLRDVNTNAVLDIVKNFSFNAKVPGLRNVSTLLSQAHSDRLYLQWSLNPLDAEKLHKNFRVHSFARGGALIALGIFAATFITQQTVFSIFQSLTHPSMGNWRVVLHRSFSVIICACLVVAHVGYFSFEYQSRDLIFSTMIPRFLGMKSPDIATNIARGLLLLTIALTYPMQLFFGRINAVLLLEKALSGCESRYDNSLFYGTTCCMWGISILVGAVTSDIVYVFSMIGAMFASPMIYILPVLCYFGIQGGLLKLFRNASTRGPRLMCKSVIFPLFVLFTGIGITILAPIITTTQKFGVTNF